MAEDEQAGQPEKKETPWYRDPPKLIPVLVGVTVIITFLVAMIPKLIPDPPKDRVFTWQLAMAVRPSLFVFSSVGRLGHDSAGNGGLEGRMTIEYRFTRPGDGITLFGRTMTIEAYRHAPLTDGFFRMVNPSHIDAYHAAVARELSAR